MTRTSESLSGRHGSRPAALGSKAGTSHATADLSCQVTRPVTSNTPHSAGHISRECRRKTGRLGKGEAVRGDEKQSPSQNEFSKCRAFTCPGGSSESAPNVQAGTPQSKATARKKQNPCFYHFRSVSTCWLRTKCSRGPLSHPPVLFTEKPLQPPSGLPQWQSWGRDPHPGPSVDKAHVSSHFPKIREHPSDGHGALPKDPVQGRRPC